jgi:hypothetical protein
MVEQQVVSSGLFPTSEHLKRWLQQSGVDLTRWGVADAKRVVDLWEELMQGETRLFASPLGRAIRMVSLLIERDDQILIELRQEMRDGRIRNRQLLPTEKLFEEEAIVSGARRCLEEELGVAEPTCELTVVSQQVQRLNSPSYPGVPTTYHVTYIAVSLPQLPMHDFTIENRSHTDPIVSHTWGWRPRTRYKLPID